MKKMKKLFSLVMALAMVMSLTVAASATGADRTITIQNASKGATYTAYKLFDAKDNGSGNIVYTGEIPSTLTDYFETNASGNVVAKEGIDNAALFDALKTWAATATATASDTAEGGPLTLNVPDGYYVITSTIDSGAAVTVDSTNPNATVYDKNSAGVPTFPTDAKVAGDDIYELGTTATYTVKLNTVNWVGADTNAKRVISYTITDNFAEGKLTNINVTGIKVGGEAITLPAATIEGFETNGSITIPWVDADNNSLYNNAAQIEISYEGTVAGTGTMTNTVSATYKLEDDPDDKDVENDPTEDIYNAKITVTKVDGEGNALAGAGFVLQNSTTGSDDYGKYYNKANNDISWVNTIEEATELKSTKEGDVIYNVMVFDGLKNGTYTLIENTVPDGYNKAANETFTIDDNDVTAENLAKVTTVENNAGLELPETGGIGTTIFTVVGGVLMVGAAVLFITKKRSED